MKVMIMTVPFFQTLTPLSTASGLFFLDMQANLVDSGAERHVPEIPVPGREGGILQDMGSKATVYTMTGKWIHENYPTGLDLFGIDVDFTLEGAARHAANMTSFRSLASRIGWNWLRLMDIERLYYSKTPIVLLSDLTPGTFALITGKRFRYRGGQPNVYEYELTFKEWSSPVVKLIAAASAGALAALLSAGELGR